MDLILLIRVHTYEQGRSYNRGKGGGNCPPPIGIAPPPTKLLENQNFPWEMTIFYSASVETLKFKQYIVKFRGLRPKPRYEHYTLL